MTCRTCQYLVVAPDSRGRIIPRAGKAYPCGYRVPDKHGLPACITGDHGFKWPPSRRCMEPDDGYGCPQHLARVKTRND